MHARTRLPLLSGALAYALIGVAAVPAHAATTASRVVLSKGHVDVVDVEYADGALEVHVHDETVDPGVERDPADVLFHVLPGARTTVPADAGYGFLGAPGAPVWVLPQSGDPELLFAGLATEELETGVFRDDSVQLNVLRVGGPGDYSVFTTDEFGAPSVLIDSGDAKPDVVALPVGGHQHANWAFEAEGRYSITVEVRATVAATGQRLSSGPVTYCFKVGA